MKRVTDKEIDELVDKIWHTSNTDKHKVIVRDWLENGIASVTDEEIREAGRSCSPNDDRWKGFDEGAKAMRDGKIKQNG